MRQWFAERPLAREFVIVASSLVLALGMSEAYLARFDPQNLMTPAYTDINGMRGFLPHARIKNINRYFNAVYTTNSMGFRGADHPLSKTPGSFRAIVLGPSHTFGIGVADDEVYSEVLAKDLASLMPRRTPETINMGWPGIRMNALEPFYREVLRPYAPDLIAVHLDLSSISAEEIFRKKSYWNRDRTSTAAVEEARGWLRSLRRLPGYTFLCEHSHIWALMRLRAASSLDNFGIEHNEPEAQPAANRTALERSWAETFGVFVDTVCADGRRGSLRVVVTIEDTRKTLFPLITRSLDERAAVDPCFAVAYLPLRDEHVYSGEGHWNQAGHRLVAETIARAIAARTGSR